MRSLGIPFGFNRSVRGAFEPGLVLAAQGLVDAWERIAAAHGVQVWTGVAVERVAIGEGVVVGGALIRADAVIVCSGGFQADAALRARHLGTDAGVVRGSRHDTGEVLEALIADGAARAGGWGDAVITPVDADSPPAEGGNRMNRYSYPYGITVDGRGRRFFDEGAGLLADTYSRVGRLLLERGEAWQVFDAAGERLLKHYAYDHATPRRAATIAELGIPGARGDRRRVQRRLPGRAHRSTRPGPTAARRPASKCRSPTGRCRCENHRSRPTPSPAGSRSRSAVSPSTSTRACSTRTGGRSRACSPQAT